MKIKTFFWGILWTCVTVIGYAQNNNNLKTNLQLLQKPIAFRFLMDSTGFSKIENPQFYSTISHANLPALNSKNIHFIDFNNDGYKDIIYQDTEHYSTTKLFVNKQNNFIEIGNYTGNFIEIKKEIKTKIYVVKHAVGCDFYSELIELTISNDNTITENRIAYHYNTKIEEINTILEQKKISGILRTQPILNNKKQIDPCSGNLIIGNQLKFIENKKITIIKKQKNWLLVIYKEKDNSILGWIKN